MATADFDLQRHLGEMETRIRADIKAASDATLRAQQDADIAKLAIEAHNGRIKSLEEKAGWLGAGITAGVFSLVGMAWHLITTGGHK
jgi:hypothetical protein